MQAGAEVSRMVMCWVDGVADEEVGEWEARRSGTETRENLRAVDLA